MLRIILADIKSMLKRPLLFIVMFLGIAAGTFALTVYWLSASNSQYLSKNWASQDKTVEIYNCSIRKQEVNDLMTLLTDGSLPDIYYATVASYDSNDYDLIGMYFPEQTKLKSGEMISAEHLGKNCAVVSADLKDGGVSLGDKVKIKGVSYKVIGVIPTGEYEPITYDVRRISDGQNFVGGVTPSQTNEALKNRPKKAMIVPLDIIPDFVFKGERNGYFHITFKEVITSSERAEIEQKIQSVIHGGVIDMSEYSLALENNTLGETISYSAAVVAGLVNIITLFAYFLRENKKQYGVYKMLGASPEKIFVICISELAVYTLFAFVIGCMGVVPFIEKSGLFLSHKPLGFLDFLGIYLFLLAVQILVSLKSISELAYGKTFGGQKGTVSNVSPKQKFLTLLSYRYSGKNVVHIASVSLLSMIISFVLTFGFSYIYDSGRYSRYVNNNFDCAVSAFAPSFYLEEGYFENSAETTEILESRLGMLYNTKGVGKVTDAGSCFAYTDEDASTLELEIDKIVFLRSVNDDFVKYSPLPLSKGSWSDFESYDMADEAAAIPCIIPKDMEDRFPLDTTLTLKIEQFDNNGEVSAITRVFKVSGIANTDALRPNHSFSDEGRPNITGYQIPYTVSSEIRKSGLATMQDFFIPEILIDGAVPDFQMERMPTYFIYSDNYDSLQSWKNDLVQYGTVFSFKELCDNYKLEYKNGGGSTYIMHAAIAGTLLLLGIGGYSLMFFASMKRSYGIYYMCGMPWKKASYLTVAGNGADILLPGIVGSIIGVIAVKGVRTFSMDTIYLSALTGFVAVFAVFFISSVIISILLSKYSPDSLMRSNQ